jgi:hypothetical protein
VATHYIEEVSEMITKCGLATLESEEDDVSLDLGECTCVQCLSLTIYDLSKRLNEIAKMNTSNTKSVIVPHASKAVVIPLYAVKSSEARFDPRVASTPVYMTKSPYDNKKQK